MTGWTVVGTTLMRPDGTPGATFQTATEADIAADLFNNPSDAVRARLAIEDGGKA